METEPIYTKNQIGLHRSYMEGISNPSAQQRRINFAISLRKQKRSSKISNIRGIPDSNLLNLPELPEIFHAPSSLTLNEKLLVCKQLLSHDQSSSYEVLKYLSNSLKTMQDLLAAVLANLDFIPILCNFLDYSFNEEIVRESAYLLCNIAGAHKHIKIIVQNDGISSLFKVIDHKYVESTGNAIWALGNILSDSQEYWQYIIDRGIIKVLHSLSKQFEYIPKSILSSIAYAIKGISLYPSCLFGEDFIVIFNLCAVVLKELDSEDIFISFSNILSSELSISIFFQINLHSFLISSLNKQALTLHSSLKSLGQIVYLDEAHIDILLSYNLLDHLAKIFMANDKAATCYAIWTLSNLAACNSKYAHIIISHNIFFNGIKALLDEDEKIRKESSFLLFNCALLDANATSQKILETRSVMILNQCLSYPEPEYLENMLDTLEILFRVPSFNDYIESDYFSSIQRLEFHANETIKLKATTIYERFF